MNNGAVTPQVATGRVPYVSLRPRFGDKRKVCIVGFCASSRGFVEYDNPEFEIWGLNRGALFMPMTPQVTRWFEMHSDTIVTWENRRPGKHVQWLNDFAGPVYMHQPVAWAQNSLAYPLVEMAEFFGPNVLRIGHMVPSAGPRQSSSAAAQDMVVNGPEDITNTVGEPYLSSSIAYELALAIWEGFEEIHLYGVDLVTDAEYAWQKPGVEFLLGWAAGHGQKVVLPANCPLLRGTLYGRGFMSERPEEMSYEQLSKRMTSLQKEAESVQIQLARVQGALGELVGFTQGQMVPGIDHEKTEARRKAMEQQIQQYSFKIQQLQGALQETAYWVHQTMAGQEPSEAMEQLRRLEKDELIADGPTTDLEALQWSATPGVVVGRVDVESPFNGNRPELVPELAAAMVEGRHE